MKSNPTANSLSSQGANTVINQQQSQPTTSSTLAASTPASNNIINSSSATTTTTTTTTTLAATAAATSSKTTITNNPSSSTSTKVKLYDEIVKEYGSEYSSYVLQILATVYFKTDRISQAIDFYKKSLRINPFMWSSFEAMCNIGKRVKLNDLII